MAAKQKEISLLPEEKTGLQSTLEKAFDWLVNTGRWIIVFTELIVILAFLSRFWLDQRLADIYAKNIQKITIIEAASDFENEFRTLQKQTEQIGSLQKEQKNQAEVLENIVALLPPDIYLTSLKVDDKAVEMEIFSLQEEGLVTFFKNLILTPFFSEVEIANITSSTWGKETKLTIKAQLSKTNINKD